MKNDDRKHLTAREIEKLIEATKGSRNEACDRCLLLMMFRIYTRQIAKDLRGFRVRGERHERQQRQAGLVER